MVVGISETDLDENIVEISTVVVNDDCCVDMLVEVEVATVLDEIIVDFVEE